MRTIYVVALILQSSLSIAQCDNITEFIKSVNQYYYHQDYEVQYSLKSVNYTGKKIEDTVISSYSVWNSSIISNSDDAKVIITKEHYLAIIPSEKTLMIGSASRQQADPLKALNDFEKDITKGNLLIRRQTLKNADIQFTVIPKNTSQMDSLLITGDCKTGKLNKISIYSRDPVTKEAKRSEIQLINQNRTKVTDSRSQAYKIENYISINGKDAKPIGLYRKYEVINSINY